MNNPVSFELAKLLKEKGFDEQCDTWSYIEDNCMAMTYDPKTCVKRPTIADVVMWLYEEKGIWISVNKKYHNGALLGFSPRIDTNDGFINCECFDSLTQAYEAVIKYALKNID